MHEAFVWYRELVRSAGLWSSGQHGLVACVAGCSGTVLRTTVAYQPLNCRTTHSVIGEGSFKVRFKSAISDE